MAVSAEVSPEVYLSADEIPEVAAMRAAVRADAWETVRYREQQLESGRHEMLPLTVDALSTAEAVLESEQSYGKESSEYQEKLAGLELDCLRLVAEWYRKKRPEYFPSSRHFFDAETGDFYSHGLSIRQMTENALRPIQNDPEEVGRRVNERVENETPGIIRKVGGFALGQMGIRTISECTDKAIDDYQSDLAAGNPHRGYNGYVPEIEKVMIRDMRFDADSGDRLEEQIGLPGIYINHYVLQEALRRRGVETRGMNKTELHGTQLLVADDLIDFVKLLDAVASEEWRTTVFMGEEVPADFHRDYENIRYESQRRQEGLADMASKVAVFVMDLAADGFDRRQAPAKVEAFVKRLLLAEAKDDHELAAEIFDTLTADSLLEVAYLESIGNNKAAFELFEQVEQMAPGGGFCGAGSCGLEGVDTSSSEGQALKKALKADSGDTLVKDKERACKCGQKSIAYAYNKNKINKLCQSCGAFESKMTR